MAASLSPNRPMALLERWPVQLAWLLIFGLVTRWSVFGDLSYFSDENFYFIAGLRMHDGLLPYVGVWDRKGPGLFLTYYLITAFGSSVLTYQIAAWLFAAATAALICRIAARFAGPLGSVLAGTLYLAALPLLGGAGGQTPVFYNAWIALAALLLVRSDPALRTGRAPPALFAAMALAGFAIAYKQTAAVEGIFFGLFALWRSWRAGLAPGRLAGIAAGMALAGAAPFLLFGLAYAALGHFPEFWHAMVTANLTKPSDVAGDHWVRLYSLAQLAAPVLAAGLLGLAAAEARPGVGDRPPRAFLAGWVIAALAGFLAVPNYYEHYVMPLLVPLCVAGARALDRRPLGLAFGLFGIFIYLAAAHDLPYVDRRPSRMAIEGIAAEIARRDPHPRLFVFEGPMQLYALVGSYPPSPLLDTFHLYFPAEDNTSHLDTAAEVRRNLAWRPSVVVLFHDWPAGEENARTAPLVRAYAAANCRLWEVTRYTENYAAYPLEVWGDCAQGTGGAVTGR